MRTLKLFFSTRPFMSLLFLALAVRLLAFAVHMPDLERPLIKDSYVYHTMAIGLIAGEGIRDEGQLSAVAQPLYPLFLASVYSISDNSRTAVIIIQMLLSALTVLIIAAMTRELAGERSSVAAGVIASLYWPLAMAATHILTETLFIFLLAGAAYSFMLFQRRGRLSLAILSGFLLGLSCLTRAVTLYMAFLAAVLILLAAWKRKKRSLVLAALLFILSFCLVMTPWTVRNWNVFKAFAPGGTNSGMVLYTGNFPPGGRGFGMNLRARDLQAGKEYILELPEIERDRALRELALQKMRENPVEVARIVALKALFFWAPADWEILGHGEGVLNPWFVWLMLFVFIWAVWSDRRKEYLVPVFITVYFYLISLATYGSPRLRLPVEPFLMILAAEGWCKLDETLLGNTRRLVFLLAMIITVSAGYYWSFEIKEYMALMLSKAGIW